MAAVDVIDNFIDALPGETRRLAHGEWGVRVAPDQAAGWPLDVGLRLVEGILRVQAHALESSDGIDPWMLLWWNRQTRYVRFACTAERAPNDSASMPNRSRASNDSESMANRSREIWVHGDLPVAAIDERGLDRLLGLVVEGAVAAREYYAPAGDSRSRNRSRSAR
ncbi:MAG: hypothetical protein H0U25_01640 [Thermoleophilaceae bacterium]|nr:hypothetical protein [Thermoleophilaceae bacterium]